MKNPWRGTSPWLFTVRGLVQLALSGLVIWGCLQVIGGHIDLADAGLADQEANIDRAAWGVLAAAALFGVYCAIRVVIGVLDIAGPREAVDGVVVRSGSRKTGDFLPRIAQDVIYRRSGGAHERDLRRQRWHELVLDTADGPRSLVVKPGFAITHQPGTRVVARVSRILKHVSSVQPVSATPDPSLAQQF